MFSDSTSNQQTNMDDLSEINEQKHCIVDILTGMSSKNYFNGIKTEDQTSVNDPELMTNPNYYRFLNDNNGNYDHPHFYEESNIFNDHITTVNINGWRQKPVEQWLTEDVLYWVYHESGKEGIGILDASLYKLNTLKGKDLLGMTLNNFITEIPNERFAKRLYNSIQSIIGNRPNNIQNIAENQQNFDLENDVANILQSCSIEDNKNYIFCYDDNNLSLANEMNIKEHDSGVDSDSGSEQNMTSDSYDELNDYLFIHNNNNKCLTQLNNSNQTNDNWQSWDTNNTINNYQDGIIVDSNNQQNVDNDDGLSMMSNDSCKPIIKQEEEDQSPPPVIKKRPGRPRGTRKQKPEKVGRLWEFLRDMLHDPKYNPSIVCWDDYDIGTFRFVQSEQVARLWGSKKENRSMTFEKFSRAMRYYYKARVFTPVQKRLVYQFGENATGWRRPDPILR